MNWEHLRCFVEVAEHKSLTAGARALSMSTATVGRKIDALEAELGLKLLHRSPSGVVLSFEGQKILTSAQSGFEQFSRVDHLVQSLKAGRLDRPIRISGTEPIIAEILAPRLPALRRLAPSALVDLSVSIDEVNLYRLEADLAIRMIRPTGDALLARRLRKIELALFASEEYLGGRDPNDIDIHDEKLLMFDGRYGEIPEVNWVRDRCLEDRVIVESASTRALLNAASAGMGIAMLPVFMAKERRLLQVRAPRVPARTPWLVFHQDLKDVPAVKTVRAWIVESCSAALGS